MAHPTSTTQQQPLRLLTPDDLVSILGIARIQIIRLARAGKLPAIKLGKAWRFRPSTIDTWLREQESAGVA